jgi:hypothetical protein
MHKKKRYRRYGAGIFILILSFILFDGERDVSS